MSESPYEQVIKVGAFFGATAFAVGLALGMAIGVVTAWGWLR